MKMALSMPAESPADGISQNFWIQLVSIKTIAIYDTQPVIEAFCLLLVPEIRASLCRVRRLLDQPRTGALQGALGYLMLDKAFGLPAIEEWMKRGFAFTLNSDIIDSARETSVIIWGTSFPDSRGLLIAAGRRRSARLPKTVGPGHELLRITFVWYPPANTGTGGAFGYCHAPNQPYDDVKVEIVDLLREAF